MIPDDRAWRHYERTAHASREIPLDVTFLVAHKLRNLAAEVDRVAPRQHDLAEAVRELADDLLNPLLMGPS